MKETEPVELKAAFAAELKKDVVAFANTAGVEIFVGISDDGRFGGLQDADFTMQQVSDAIRNGIPADVTMFTHLSFFHQERKPPSRSRCCRLQGARIACRTGE